MAGIVAAIDRTAVFRATGRLAVWQRVPTVNMAVQSYQAQLFTKFFCLQ